MGELFFSLCFVYVVLVVTGFLVLAWFSKIVDNKSDYEERENND